MSSDHNTAQDREYHRKRGKEIMRQIHKSNGLFDNVPIANPERDKAWELFIKRKDAKALMRGSEDFKFPLDGSYDLWCIAWNMAWDEGFSQGWNAAQEEKT